MKVAIRPPEYFPSASFFGLLSIADSFVLADGMQYVRQSFQNRALLRTPQGKQWITVPVSGGQHGKPLSEVKIDNSRGWIGSHWKSLQFNYRSAPYFEYYEEEFAPFFDQQWEMLCDLTTATVLKLASLLFPELGNRVTLVERFAAADTDIVVELAESAPHARRTTRREIEVVQFSHPKYRQVFAGFEPGLSALDVLFNLGPAAGSVITAAAEVVSPV